ncbi:MAG TPA: NUDIX hydrolase [Candidatus Saccharimonadales bacterium]|nr:NUDIX hydrolase [Candidatus Saccharimonadales bacterium]
MPEPVNPWRTLSSRIVHQSPWLTLYEDDVIKPNGEAGKYTYAKSPPFVLVVGYDGERSILVRQFRYPLKREMIEFPGGSIDEGEGPLEAAKREFEEETGLKADKWTKLGVIHNPNIATVFLAEQLTETGKEQMDEDGIANVARLAWHDIDRLVSRGEFTDSKTLAALLLFERHHPKA